MFLPFLIKPVRALCLNVVWSSVALPLLSLKNITSRLLLFRRERTFPLPRKFWNESQNVFLFFKLRIKESFCFQFDFPAIFWVIKEIQFWKTVLRTALIRWVLSQSQMIFFFINFFSILSNFMKMWTDEKEDLSTVTASSGFNYFAVFDFLYYVFWLMADRHDD